MVEHLVLKVIESLGAGISFGVEEAGVVKEVKVHSVLGLVII